MPFKTSGVVLRMLLQHPEEAVAESCLLQYRSESNVQYLPCVELFQECR